MLAKCCVSSGDQIFRNITDINEDNSECFDNLERKQLKISHRINKTLYLPIYNPTVQSSDVYHPKNVNRYKVYQFCVAEKALLQMHQCFDFSCDTSGYEYRQIS